MELIDPVTGLKRVWGRNPDAEPALQAAAKRPGFQAVVPARLNDHQFGQLWTPVTPTMAKSVLANAISGDLQSQFELFSVMEDSWDRLSKCLNEVRNGVKRLQWSVATYSDEEAEPGQAAKEKADTVKRGVKNWLPTIGSFEYGFEEFLYHGLDAMGKGLSVQEVIWDNVQGEILPRAAQFLTPKNYGWSQDGSQIGLISGRSWQPFDPDVFSCGQWHSRSGAPGATALLRPLVPYWIGMTYGWRWLLQTAQIFGVPFRWATYDADNAGLKEKVAEMLENLGSSGWAAFPSGTTLEFKEAVQSARDNPQMLIIELAKKACDLLILGQELSSESQASGLGSGNALLQGKVRQDVLHNAAAWAADLVNYQLIPAILRRNYGNASEAPTICPDLSIDPDPKTKAERDQILFNSVDMKVQKSWFYERHGIPKPEEGDETISGKAPAGPVQANGDPAADNPPGEPNQPKDTNMAAKAFADSVLEAKDASVADKLISNVLEDLTGVEAKWLGGVKPFFRKLVEAARDENLTDDQFLAALDKAQKDMPELFGKLDKQSLEEAFYSALSAATVNGAIRGFMSRKVRRK